MLQPNAPPHEWSKKSSASVVGSRTYYDDGRIIDFEDAKPCGPGGAEVELWSSGKDWRSGLDVSCNPIDLNATQMRNASVRIYARTGTTRSLLKQGRILEPLNMSRLVARVRGYPCDEYVVTCMTENDFQPGSPIPLFSFSMYGLETSPVPDVKQTILTQLNNVVVSFIPAFLYGFYVSLSPTAAATEFLWIADRAATFAGGENAATAPLLIPPIPIAPGSVASLHLQDDQALRTFTGLAIGLSTTYDTYTQSADTITTNVVYT